ncbi:MAG TPA: glycosyltransferase family 4 protein [Kiritimatiellia bacterium]|nr:glycosyltransferase family 4 protein [Kiritimatiellia bacterium]
MAISSSTVLFLEKVLLRPPPDPLRGVELFNLHLLDDLLHLGYRLLIPVHTGWKSVFESRGILGRATCIWLSPRGLKGLIATWGALRKTSFDVVLVANVGNGLIPLLLALPRRGGQVRLVLIAHREATSRFVAALRLWPACVVAVNEKIAGPFRTSGFKRVSVDYGIFDADRFFPEPRAAREPVRFVVLGALDNAWKGADTARAAFAQLPGAVRARCELHLASYATPPRDVEPGVVAHPWMPAAAIPAFLRAMDIMLCPSRDERVMRETFSQVIVQGMLTGLPVIASDLPIFRGKLDRGGGHLFQSVGELSRRMAALAENPALWPELGAQGRATALDRYVWDTARFAARYIEPNPT